MIGSVPGFRRGPTRFGIALIGAVLLLDGLISVPTTAAQAPPRPVAEQPPARIAYSGTEHRSLGVTATGLPGQSATQPLLDESPQHFDQDVSSRGGLLVFTSLRDEPRPQVYLRDADGEVRRLTRGRDAANPQLSPDLQWVAFDSAETSGQKTQRDIWLVRVDGTDAHRLAETSDNDSHPTFSPDGSRIAYACDAGGRWQIYDQASGGGSLRRLTDEPSGGAIQPSWNPVDDAGHRDQIAYTFDRDGNIGDASDQSVRVLRGTGTGAPLLDDGWQSREPRWLPNGEQLLFVSPNLQAVQGVNATAADSIDRVYRADTTTLPAPRPQQMLEEDRKVDSPTWFSNGITGRLVVARTTAELRNTATLQDIRQDGSDPRSLGLDVLTEDPKAVVDSSKLFEPDAGFDPWTQRQSYSPDGSKIAVSRFETVGGQRVQRIWVVGSDGSDPRLLPIADRKGGDWETDAAWSPDGKKIAVARRSPGAQEAGRGRSRIIVVDVATGEVTGRLQGANPEEDDTQPAFSPDGQRFAFSRGRVADVPAGRLRENHIWIARAEGLDQHRDLSELICRCDVVDDSPAFSPDGRSIVFNREPDGLFRMYLADDRCEVLLPKGLMSCADRPDGGETGPFQPRDASSSPDGEWLVLSKRQAKGVNSPEHLATLDMAKGQPASITDRLPGRQKEPTWQATVDLALTALPSSATVEVGSSVPVTATIRNNGPAASPGTKVTLDVPEGLRLQRLRTAAGSCDAENARCDLGVVQPGKSVQVTAELVGVTAGNHRIRWTAGGAMQDSHADDNTATTIVPVTPVPPPPPPPPDANPGVAVEAQPNPSYVGGRTDVTYTVRNTGGGTATGLALDIALPAGVQVVSLPPDCSAVRCALPDLPPGGVITKQVVLAPNAALEAVITTTLRTTGTDADPADNLAASPYRVLQPRIVAVPNIGEPGFVTSVRGIDFPPGAPVQLLWTPGITAATAPTLPGLDGRFAAQLLILPKDQTGPRTITASGPGFGPVTTQFLVVKPTIAPPDLVGRR
ncbi:hypothetical protein AB0I53_04095 [Saccharopolyspora sp. NPDC050389]|uniref:hypothetical protein n=1 Tax=Saccharopolyspora sp. NPDC050389 TaxID=3155516 RepID=UPI0033EB9050